MFILFLLLLKFNIYTYMLMFWLSNSVQQLLLLLLVNIRVI